MWRFLKKLYLRIQLRFAKRYVGLDVGAVGHDQTAWCECRKVGGIIYITKQGFGNPPAEVLKGGQIYSH